MALLAAGHHTCARMHIGPNSKTAMQEDTLQRSAMNAKMG